MIISIDWLKEFVDIEENPNELADLLSIIGLEAELGSFPTEISGVVIGKVESTDKHPNADKLKVCTVNDGNKNHTVVCGAPNVQKGQTIAFATVGSILPGNFKIKKATIRGVESSGMICSERELNISEEHDGIMVLPNNLSLGENFISSYGNKYFSLKLDITPNRADAFSHIGVARDISCKTDRNFKKIIPNEISSAKKTSFDIGMENKQDCPRYIGAIVEKIKVGPSPNWLVERLKSIGQRSINNIVDISNYVLMEMGHPTHIFDFDTIKNKSIYVRRARKGEEIITLDDQKHKLDQTHLLITDGNIPLALAGIMGGADTAVSHNTDTILIESAYFDPITIRKSSKNLSLITDASKRFERGADPNGCKRAFWRVLNLVSEIAGGELSSEVIDIYPDYIEKKNIKLRKNEIEIILGIKIEDSLIEKILNRLEIELKNNHEGWDCQIPTFRPDITREIDLIEEIARIYGYDNIPTDESLSGSFIHENPDPEKYLKIIRNTLVGCGFHQVYSNSLQNEKESAINEHSPVKMLNPLNIEMSYLRTSLLPGLLKAANHNQKHSINSFRLFELGNIHLSKGEGLENIIENTFLSGLVTGFSVEPSVHSKGQKEDLFALKGYLELLFIKKLGMNFELSEENHQLFDHAWSIIINRKKVGSVGKISGELIKKMKFDLSEILAFEINLDPIKYMFNKKKYFKKINSYPKISRDLNLVMPTDKKVGEIVDVIFKKGKKLIIDVDPVDIFTDEKTVGKGLKSVTYNITFQSSSKTLEDKDVNSIIDEIIHIADKNFNAKLRV